MRVLQEEIPAGLFFCVPVMGGMGDMRQMGEMGRMWVMGEPGTGLEMSCPNRALRNGRKRSGRLIAGNLTLMVGCLRHGKSHTRPGWL